MARSIEKIEQELMGLSHEERARLAHSLIVSLDEGVNENVDAYWQEELSRRDEAIKTGRSKTIPAEEAMRAARKSLKK